VQKQQAVHTAGGNLFFAYKICYVPFPLELFPFTISSIKLLPFPWESQGMEIPIPMLTSSRDAPIPRFFHIRAAIVAHSYV